MMGVDQPPLPDPDTCTRDEWEYYRTRVDYDALDDDEFRAHRAANDAYGRRLDREWDAWRARWKRLLDERDRTDAYAEELSQRRQKVYKQMLDQGNEVIRLRNLYMSDSPAVVEANRRWAEMRTAVDELNDQLMAANAAAIEAFRESRR